MNFRHLLGCDTIESDGLSEIVLSSFPDSYNTNAVMKYMPIGTCSNPPGIDIKVVMNLFFIIIFAKIFRHWNVQAYVLTCAK